MKVVIDSKLLVYRAAEFASISDQLLSNSFKITRNQDGDLNVVKFENIKVELIFNNTYREQYHGRAKTEVKFKLQEKSKYLADSIILTNKKIKFIGNEKKDIVIEQISQLQLTDDSIYIFANKKKYQVNTKSFKLNVYLITMLEWISSNIIDQQFENKTVKFKVENK